MTKATRDEEAEDAVPPASDGVAAALASKVMLSVVTGDES